MERITEGKTLFQTYYKDVFRACNYMLHNKHDAEDLCQEVFIKAITKDFPNIDNQKSWLLSIAMNMSRNYLKKKNRVILKEAIFPFNRSTEIQRSEPEEQESELVELLNKLPVRIRKVMILKYVHECKDKEISEILKIPEGTVKSRHFKGKKLIKKLFHDNQYYFLEWRKSFE
ncbi:RNA polymerase sigma-70 factor, ECF subfamily [Gracilibacillus ureilyticus]|uniref:RNA polymerase sigma-70 factor, ECF subfamily n=1 Tax=Gracilibacillus ureilyticus TaxID=531814 RepID=A0A1H9W142_9BACI|nr:RNA polymerase sigma factor [Gracilibacillus ureilyticus]SES27612.1 RNA polymerase sigma-70 factor, ECF subfamily [Gracilibacillus ureilyticus]